MRKLLFLFLLGICYLPYSCTQGTQEADTAKDEGWRHITDDYMKWYSYTYYNIRLSRDFIGLDTDSGLIDKPAFISKLMTGNVFAYKTGTKQNRDIYKLYALNTQDESIKAVIQQTAAAEMEHYKMEGRPMPAFSFNDINGNHYDNASVKGKLLVIKCWFIGCVACVKEFPELNKLVDSYKGNDQVLFVSLAFDTKEPLVRFLKTKEFKYAVVPEMKKFMSEDLSITTYPTHLLIDRSGKIVKVVNRIDDLVPFIEKAL
jgi:thiol-disulfide isomerase/thioredoxin